MAWATGNHISWSRIKKNYSTLQLRHKLVTTKTIPQFVQLASVAVKIAESKYERQQKFPLIFCSNHRMHQKSWSIDWARTWTISPSISHETHWRKKSIKIGLCPSNVTWSMVAFLCFIPCASLFLCSLDQEVSHSLQSVFLLLLFFHFYIGSFRSRVPNTWTDHVSLSGYQLHIVLCCCSKYQWELIGFCVRCMIS